MADEGGNCLHALLRTEGRRLLESQLDLRELAMLTDVDSKPS